MPPAAALAARENKKSPLERPTNGPKGDWKNHRDYRPAANPGLEVRTSLVRCSSSDQRHKRIRRYVLFDELNASVAEADVATARVETVHAFVVVAVHDSRVHRTVRRNRGRSDSVGGHNLRSIPNEEQTVRAVGLHAAVTPLVVG